MLTFGTKQGTNAVLESLCHHGPLRMQDLFSSMKKEQNIDLSLPQVYKIVTDLEKEQVIIKEYGKFALSSFWIKRVDSFIQQAKNIYTTWSIDITGLTEGKNREFHVDSLDELDAIRNSVFTQLNTINTTEDVCFYHSHPYYILWANEARSTLINHVIENGQKLFILFGNSYFLDTYGIQIVSMQGAHAQCKEDTSFMREGYNLHVVGEYTMELLFPDTITQHFKIFFDNVKSLDGFNADLFKEIFRMKWNYTLIIQHNSKQAEKFRTSIKKAK